MRITSIAFLAALALVMTGCGKTADTATSTTTGTVAEQTADRSAEVAGSWTLNVDATSFTPNDATKGELDKQGMAAAAVAELERQLKDQIKAKLGDAVWTFNADKTASVKTKNETITGTWTLTGNEITLKTTKPPEAHMTLSTDGKELSTTNTQDQGTITLKLKKS